MQWGGRCVVDHNPNTTNDATAVTFSVECFNSFNSFKLYLLPRKHRQKVVCFILFLFIHEHLIIMWHRNSTAKAAVGRLHCNRQSASDTIRTTGSEFDCVDYDTTSATPYVRNLRIRSRLDIVVPVRAFTASFLSRVITLMRDIDIVNLSVTFRRCMTRSSAIADKPRDAVL